MKTATLALGSRLVGEGQPCLVVAHVGTAHEGEADTALRLIEAAFQAGADAIVFPVFRATDLLARRHPERKELEAAELSAREWKKVLEAARASGLAVVVEAFDAASRDLAAEAGVDAFQAHPTDLDHPELLRVARLVRAPAARRRRRGGRAARARRPRRGGGPGRAPRRPAGARRRPPRSCGSPRSGRSASATACRSVSSTRPTAGRPSPSSCPPSPPPTGPTFVEKRLTLDRSRKGRDWAAALSPEEFYRMVELLRQAERARGDGEPRAAAHRRPRALDRRRARSSAAARS